MGNYVGASGLLEENHLFAPPKQSSSQGEASQPKDRTDFSTLINLQSSEGYWTKEADTALRPFVKTKISSLSNPASSYDSQSRVLYTLVALCVLSEHFYDREDEWQLIA